MRAPARKACLVERASRLRSPFYAATVASERTIPILPCRLRDDVLPFYDALAFEVTYRQARPNPYAVVCLDDIQLHFCEPPEFDPTAA